MHICDMWQGLSSTNFYVGHVSSSKAIQHCYILQNCCCPKTGLLNTVICILALSTMKELTATFCLPHFIQVLIPAITCRAL